jgi:hypothetical protein
VSIQHCYFQISGWSSQSIQVCKICWNCDYNYIHSSSWTADGVHVQLHLQQQQQKNYFTTSGACGTGWPSSFHTQLPSPAATKYLGLQMLLSTSRAFRTFRSASSTLRFASLALSHCLFITFSVRSDHMTTDSFGDKPCTETYQHRIRTCPQYFISTESVLDA